MINAFLTIVSKHFLAGLVTGLDRFGQKNTAIIPKSSRGALVLLGQSFGPKNLKERKTLASQE